VIKAASGQTLKEFVQDRILTPLNMRDTHFCLPPGKSDRLAAVYGLRSGEALSRAPDGPGMTTQGQYEDGPRKSFSGGAGG